VRILYFTRDYTPHDHRFLSAMVSSGLDVLSLRLERHNLQTEDRPLPNGVEQVLWRGGKRPLRLTDGVELLYDLQQVFRKVKPDVVHAGPLQSCALLTALTGFHPLVSMSWGSDLLRDSGRNRFWRIATRYTLARTEVLVGDCEAVSLKAQEFGLERERIVLFPWGVDLDHFSPAPGGDLRRSLGWKDMFVILSSRSWEPVYGVDLMVNAFARAAQKNKRLRMLLLGSGSQAEQLREILVRYDVLERVHFGGQISYSDLPKYYRAADLYVSASHSDGSSVSLLEALACGRPVLVSDIPGNREWVSPNSEGWLFADGDEDALVETLLKIVNIDKGLTVMGERGRKLAEEKADWSKNFQKLLGAYDLALKVKR
jgi:glycosyltransferase involved in cell wall biosynthesis